MLGDRVERGLDSALGHARREHVDVRAEAGLARNVRRSWDERMHGYRLSRFRAGGGRGGTRQQSDRPTGSDQQRDARGQQARDTTEAAQMSIGTLCRAPAGRARRAVGRCLWGGRSAGEFRLGRHRRESGTSDSRASSRPSCAARCGRAQPRAERLRVHAEHVAGRHPEHADSIADQQVPASAQFGTARYALLFEPGTYGSTDDPLTFQVGYYTEVAGSGGSPDDVTINGSVDVYNQCDSTNSCVALNNFWRSLSNLTINVTGQTGCESGTILGVSQASPMRRVKLTGGNLSLMDYCNGSPDYASGGFIADSAFSGTVVNGSQQQFFVRNSDLNGWSNSVWNQVFVGDAGAGTTFASNSGDPGGPPSYTTLANTPISEEEPFLQADDSGNYGVFVPSPQTNTSGASWDASAGTTLPISKFFIATPSTSVGLIDLELLLGKNLILTPGVYDLKAPIEVTRTNTVVLGMGFATLVPQNGTAAINVLQAQGVKLSGLIIDAGPKNSSVLMRIGTSLSPRRQPDRPHARAGRVLPRRRRDRRLGHHEPRRRRLERGPRRYLGVARRPRQRRRLDGQHRCSRPRRQRQQRDRIRPGGRALSAEPGDLERAERRGCLLSVRDALRPAEPGSVERERDRQRLPVVRDQPPGQDVHWLRDGRLQLLQSRSSDRGEHGLPSARHPGRQAQRSAHGLPQRLRRHPVGHQRHGFPVSSTFGGPSDVVSYP